MSSTIVKHSLYYDANLASNQLGKDKYAKPISAIFELVSNALDAHASEVKIVLSKSSLDILESITVSDNGDGISEAIFETKFLCVGKKSIKNIGMFGKFGLGRFSVFRLGSLSRWTSHSIAHKTTSNKIQFTMRYEDPNSFELQTSNASNVTGTVVEVFNLWEDISAILTEKYVKDEILSNFFVFLIGNKSKRIFVNESVVNVDDYVQDSDVEEITVKIKDEENIKIFINHLWLKKSIERENGRNNILLFGDGKLVHQTSIDMAVPSNYLCLANSSYFSDLTVSNRESIATLDPNFNLLLENIVEKIKIHLLLKKDMTAISFLEEARKQDYYPYKSFNPSAQMRAKQALYDVALEKINEYADVSKLTKKAQAVIFRLLNRAMSNANILEVLEEVAKLSDEDADKFRRVLEKTTLEQIIRLSDEVANRLSFLNSLHEMTYGDMSKKLKERKELHKILERNVWIFGEKYQLAASDKSFRTLIARHRSQLGLVDTPDEELKKIKDYKKIPDLYLASKRMFPIEPKFHNLVVEIKAPIVSIGDKEVAQIKKYADIIKKSPEIVKDNSVWELILVSSEVEESVDTDRFQNNRPKGLLIDSDSIKVWVFKWSELIQKSRSEMMIVSEHLKLKTDELAVSEDLRKEFPFLSRENYQSSEIHK